MEATKNKKLLVTKIVLLLILIIAGIVADATLSLEVERQARQQAKYNLDQIKYCVNRLVDDSGVVPDENNIARYLQVCSQKMRVSPTGDTFAFRLDNNKFVFDPSLDCQVDGGKKATNDGLCGMFSDPDSCVTALVSLKSGYDSTAQRVKWKFLDDSYEWLEWKVLPDEDTGFRGLRRNGIIKPFQVVVAQGVIVKELMDIYKPYVYTLHGLMLLVMFVILVIMYIIERKHNAKKQP